MSVPVRLVNASGGRHGGIEAQGCRGSYKDISLGMGTAIYREGGAPCKLHQAVIENCELKHRDRYQLHILLNGIRQIETAIDLFRIGQYAIHLRPALQPSKL